MTKKQRAEILKIQEEVWRQPFFRKLLLAQLAAGASSAYAHQNPTIQAQLSLVVACEILKQLEI